MAKLQKSPHEGAKGSIGRRPSQRIAAIVCGVPVIASLLSGCMFNKKNERLEDAMPNETINNEIDMGPTAPTIGDYNLEIVDPNKEVTIPYDAVIPSINQETGLFEFIHPDSIKTIRDLEQIETLDMYYHGENEDLSWLRNCENLTDLVVVFYGEYLENMIQIRNIARIPNLKKLTIKFPREFSFNNYGFLLELEIDKLELCFNSSEVCQVDEELLNKLNQRFNLTITGESYELITSNKEEITIDGNDLSQIDWNVEINISPDMIFNYHIISKDGKLYARDLVNLKELEIKYSDTEDLSWLKYCINLKVLSIDFNDNDKNYANDYNLNVKALQAITKIPNLESIHFNGVTEFKRQDYEFLNSISTLTKLTISSSGHVPINADFSGIENLTNIKDLILNYNSPNIYIDFLKMENLNTLTFGHSPYTVVLEFNNDMYYKLMNKGCIVNFKDESDLSKFIAANKQLDDIVSSFNLKENASDADKFDAMLCWILDNYRYSIELASISRTIGLSKDEIQEKESEMARTFYENGLLTAFFEGNGTSICGNYAAKLEALANRLDFNSSYVESEDHAYNLVVFEGEYYYVDATWLDPVMLTDEYYDAGNADIIRAGNGRDLVWYLCSPEDVLIHDNSDSHKSINIPTDFEFNNVKANTKEEKIFDITGKLVEFVANGKKYIVPAAILIGILIAFGLAKKAKKARRRTIDEDDDDYYNDEDNDFENNYPRGYGR